MVEHGEWEVCTHTPTQTVLPSQLLSDSQNKELLGVPVTQPMVDLLCVLACQAAIKNGAVAGANSAVIDLTAFNAKAAITSAIQQVKNAEQALHMAETSTQGLAMCLRKARQSLEDRWADTQTVSFANTGVKHAAITMADVGARAVHAGLRTLRAQALRVRTVAHGHNLDVLTKDSLFLGNLGKAVAKAATASRNYKALGDCFVLSGLSRPKPSRSLKRKASTSPLPFRGNNRSRYHQGQTSPTHQPRKRKRGARGTGNGQQSGKQKQPQWQPPNRRGSQANRPKSKRGNKYTRRKGSNT